MKKLEDDTAGRKVTEVDELVDQETITEDPPTIGGGTGAHERPKQK